MVHTRAPPFNLRGTATMFEWKKQKARWKRWLYDIQYYITIWYETKYAYYYKISYITYYIIHSYIFQILPLSLLQKADFMYHLGKTTFLRRQGDQGDQGDQGGLPGVKTSWYGEVLPFLTGVSKKHARWVVWDVWTIKSIVCLFMFLGVSHEILWKILVDLRMLRTQFLALDNDIIP